MPRLDRDAIRQIDAVAIEQFGMPGIILMENAGRGAAAVIARQTPPPYLIACGGGNNGGDGYVIARHLDSYGLPVQILRISSMPRGDAAVMADIVGRSGIAMMDECEFQNRRSDQPGQRRDGWLESFATIIDCGLGTGFSGDLRDPYDRLMPILNAADAVRVAIDVPTGLDCQTGRVAAGAFRADRTLTFVAQKRAFGQAEVERYTGQITVLPIGVPADLLRRFDLAPVRDDCIESVAPSSRTTGSG